MLILANSFRYVGVILRRNPTLARNIENMDKEAENYMSFAAILAGATDIGADDTTHGHGGGVYALYITLDSTFQVSDSAFQAYIGATGDFIARMHRHKGAHLEKLNRRFRAARTKVAGCDRSSSAIMIERSEAKDGGKVGYVTSSEADDDRSSQPIRTPCPCN